MNDSSPNGLNGIVGRAIKTGMKFGKATGYTWSLRDPDAPPPEPKRLIRVADDRLNPGNRDFAITVRFRTRHGYGNVLQKGQADTPGGYFKWELPKGRLTCLFRSRDQAGKLLGEVVVKSRRNRPLNDGRWHTARCERRGDEAIMTIDGGTTIRRSARSGPISNTMPLTIGGKFSCDQKQITCDYFSGSIDWVKVTASSAPPPPSGAIFADGFTGGSFAAWSSVSGLTIDATQGSPSAPSARGNPTSAPAFAYRTLPSTYGFGCLSARVNVTTQTGAVDLFRLRTSSGGPVARAFLDPDRKLAIRSDVSGQQKLSGIAVGSGWHTVELCGTVGLAGSWDLYRDGTKIVTAWAADTGTKPIGRVQIGDTAAKTWKINLDDVVFDQQVG
jgi:hypothetical protein